MNTTLRNNYGFPVGWLPAVTDLLDRRPDLAGIGLAAAAEVARS